MWPVRVSNPGPLLYESGALPTALRGPVAVKINKFLMIRSFGSKKYSKEMKKKKKKTDNRLGLLESIQ